jgi:hypothetical protein
MKRSGLGMTSAAFACIGLIIPSWSFAAPPGAATNDVALRAGGVLLGQVVDQQGIARPDSPVSIQYAGNEVVRTTTDQNGVFAAKGLRGGQYQLLTPDGGSTCRLWAPDTAPPSARPAALIVAGNDVVRGQGEGGPAKAWGTWLKAHPYLVAGTVVSAIAIPLVLADDDWDTE